jgi:hypothetical protein
MKDVFVESNVSDDCLKCSRYGMRIPRSAVYLQYAAMTRDTRNADSGLFRQPSMKKAPGNPVASVPRGFDCLWIQSLMPVSEPTPSRAGHPLRVPLGAGERLGYRQGRHGYPHCFFHKVHLVIIDLITFLQSIRKVNLSRNGQPKNRGPQKRPILPEHCDQLLVTSGKQSTP